MKLRWGIISAGLISQDFCIGLKTLDPKNHSIEAVAARSLEDAKQFAQRFQVSSFFDSYDHVYTNDKVDIVYVGNVNTAHKEACLKAIANGKHVLCEKPMSLNCKEQDEVLEAAKSKGVFFMEGLWTRFFPAIDRLRLELNNDSIGQVKIVQANFFAKINHIDRLSQKALGGGAVLDIGIYPIQYVCLLFNHEMPIEIVASGHLMDTGVDEVLNIALKYKNNRMAVVTIAINCILHSSVLIVGETGILHIPDFAWCPTELTIANKEILNFDLPSTNEKMNFAKATGLAYEAEAVRQAINSGLTEHPYVAHDHSRVIAHIIEESRKQVGYFLPSESI